MAADGFCTSCGKELGNDVAFCSSCGKSNPVYREDIFCKKCGESLTIEDVFCFSCGTQNPNSADAINKFEASRVTSNRKLFFHAVISIIAVYSYAQNG